MVQTTNDEITKFMTEHDPNDPELLFKAAQLGSIPICLHLLQTGNPWNQLNKEGKSIGEIALLNNHLELYEEFVRFGCRSEFILTALGQKVVGDGELVVTTDTVISNQDYLKKKLVYSKDCERLLDEDKNGVMMGWERPIMQVTVDNLDITGKRVLNVGFGLGIIDKLIQSKNPLKHTIVEAHPDVYQRMLDEQWHLKPNVEILYGRWQDVDLGLYDVVYFDTFGEYYDDLKEFHEILPNILDQDGQYSFFNGLAGTNKFFHDVACEVCELDLRDMGFEVKFVEFKCEELGDEVWNGVKRAYWNLDIYRLPLVTFSQDF